MEFILELVSFFSCVFLNFKIIDKYHFFIIEINGLTAYTHEVLNTYHLLSTHETGYFYDYFP